MSTLYLVHLFSSSIASSKKKEKVEIGTADIKSTFSQLSARQWEGTHVYKQVVIVRTFRNVEPGVLTVDTRYYSGGKLVERLMESYRMFLDQGGERPYSYDGKPIDEFARSIHYTDLTLDVDIALDRL